MKSRFAQQSLAAVLFTAVPFLNGCTQQNAGKSPAYVTTSSPPVVVTQVAPAATPAPANPEPTLEATVPPLIISNAPPVVVAEPVLPANLRISKPLNEVIRLAQSGVDEMVILTYVTNSPAVFTLGAEEIVYLNDLGIASSVITSMMQHDQALKYAWANAAQPAASATVEPVAAAPTYVNPPQPTPVVEAQPAYVSNDYFYNTLSPYGSWVEIDGYGRCWRPTVAINSSGWQPYRDRGRWVHTDAGWYWMSDYSWGSVAFHYGRWFSHPRWGWCWWPDTTWGPSWVTWRYDNDNCGWAPLPPRTYFRTGGFYYQDRVVGVNFDFGLSVGSFCFVPWTRFCDPYPYRYCLPRPRSVAIYNNTTVINNVVIGNNNTIINRGISTDRVREHTRTEVRTVSIREERPRSGGPRQERFERDGRTLVVNRPSSIATRVETPTPSAGERGSTRIAPTRGSEPFAVKPTTSATSGRTEINERKEARPARDTDNRSSGRTTTPNNITPTSPAVVTAPPTTTTPVTPTTPTRNERRPLPGREVPKDNDSNNRDRPASATVVRVPETPTTTTPTPVRTPTPIFSKPVVVERPVYTPTRTIDPIPAPAPNPAANGNNRNSRSNGRDNSVWSNPNSQSQPATPGNAPNYRNAPSRSQNNFATDNPPQAPSSQPTYTPPTYNRPNVETRREENRNNMIERSAPSRSAERSSSATYSAPAPRASAPVITPAPAPAPRPSYTPPAPAPRVESPAPSRSEPARSESKSEPGRPGRNR